MNDANTALTMHRRFAAPVAKLFRAWHTPEQMRKWHSPVGGTVPEANVDFRVGGGYRLVITGCDSDKRNVITGEYLEIIENSLLRFTWQWEGGTVRTEVELRFSAHPDGSELQLTHRRFTDAAMRDEHNRGWTGCLDNLTQFLASTEGVTA